MGNELISGELQERMVIIYYMHLFMFTLVDTTLEDTLYDVLQSRVNLLRYTR